MWMLWMVTALWAFSFSLIDVYVAPYVDSYLAVFVRTGLAFLLFLPLLRLGGLTVERILTLTAVGALQIGVMYLFLYHSFGYLSVPEILLFTIFTPLYVTLIDEWVLNRQRLPIRWWMAAALAVVGAGVIRYQGVSESFLIGFLLIQGANICFAAGQVIYKRMPLGGVREQTQVFGLFFLGASVVSGLGALLFGDWARVPSGAVQWGVLVWLGLGASGVGYLCWNMATKWVNVGQLATMNNMLIPAGILVNFVFWNRDIDIVRLAIGGAIIVLSVWLCQRRFEPSSATAQRDGAGA